MSAGQDESATHLHHPALGHVVMDRIGGPARLKIIAVLGAVLALSSADMSTIGSIAAPLERGLKIDNTQIGLLVTLSVGIGAVATLPMGALVDRVNRTRLLYGAVLLWTVTMIVNGLSVDYTMLLVSRLALGAVMAVGGPAIASLTGDWFPESDRGRVYGFVLTGELVGTGIGFIISGSVGEAFGWRWPFFVLAIIGLSVALMLRRTPEPLRGGDSRLPAGARSLTPRRRRTAAAAAAQGPVHAAEQDRHRETDPLTIDIRRAGIEPRPPAVVIDEEHGSLWDAVRYSLAIPSNVVLIISSSLGYFFLTGLQTFAVLYARDRFEVKSAVASLLLVLLGVGAVIGVLVSGRVSDGLIARGYIPARPVVAGIAYSAAAVLFVGGLLAKPLALAVPLFALAAAALGASNPPVDAARLDIVDDSMWGRAEAVRTTLRSALQAVAPLLIGYLSTVFGSATSGLNAVGGGSSVSSNGIPLRDAFLIMTASLIVAGVLMFVVGRRTYPGDVAAAIVLRQKRGQPGASSSDFSRTAK